MLFTSAYFSLFVQFIVGIFNIYGLNIDVPQDKMIFSDILKLEFFVQIIEFIFYVWMTINFELIKNITPYRYLDWIITTPTMLLTFIVYLSNKDNANLKEFLIKNKSFIIEIFILNLIMLVFGLAGELNYIDYRTGIILGFIPFIYYFKMIYDKYFINDTETNIETNYAEINSTDNNKMKVYWFFLIVWSIYGIVAFLPYEEKNTAYNILDLFAKNFFSVFLVIILINLKKNS
jgi:bacteriorhodopsin